MPVIWMPVMASMPMVFAALIELLVRQRNERFAHGDRSLPKWTDQVSERELENLELCDDGTRTRWVNQR